MNKPSNEKTLFPSGAVRDNHTGKGRLDLLPSSSLLRLSRLYEKGAEMYGEDNWQKGIPMHSYIDSALRHIMKYQHGCDDEDHLAAAAWNILCAMWTEVELPEMNDLKKRVHKNTFSYFSSEVNEDEK